MKSDGGRLCGIWGRPWIDLGSVLDTACFDALDREITAGLARVDAGYTGGTLKWMGVTAPWIADDGYRDAMEAVRAMTRDEFRDFIALGDDGVSALDPDRRGEYVFGDETDRPFSRAQERLLAYRHGVYFPWKVCYHLLENDRWEDKHHGAGKDFGDEARAVFPATVAYVRSLPFREIGRCVVFGLEPNDHAPLHRDTEPGAALQVAQSVSFAPRAGKRFYLQNAEDAPPAVIDARIYWFNDMDYHGVLPDPCFRYSVRVDGVFEPAWVRDLERRVRARR
jgi:hypothetical protein